MRKLPPLYIRYRKRSLDSCAAFQVFLLRTENVRDSRVSRSKLGRLTQGYGLQLHFLLGRFQGWILAPHLPHQQKPHQKTVPQKQQALPPQQHPKPTRDSSWCHSDCVLGWWLGFLWGKKNQWIGDNVSMVVHLYTRRMPKLTKWFVSLISHLPLAYKSYKPLG